VAQETTAVDGITRRSTGGAKKRNAGPMQKEKEERQFTVEWPTVGLALTIYGGFGLLTWFYQTLPWWVVLPLGGYLVAWHGSLQHEVVHGHPTQSNLLNELTVLPSLWLWMPFRVYRNMHLTHHRNEFLTDPLEDPESYYLTAENWAACGTLRRTLYWAHNTCLGRLLLGPFRSLWSLLRHEAARIARRDTALFKDWAVHFVGAGLVLCWVCIVCGIPFWEYLLFFVYPGLSLTLLRSFVEHQARVNVSERSIIVEAGPFFSLLYLNNNLHLVHHRIPGLPWYRIPSVYRAQREDLLQDNGHYLMRGYGEIIARYLLWPKEQVMHPASGQAAHHYAGKDQPDVLKRAPA